MTPATANAELLTLAVLDHEHPTDATPPDGDVRVPPARELHRRVNDGITVVMLWRAGDDGVTVAVEDARTGERFELAVAGRDAMDAFMHPFAWAAARR